MHELARRLVDRFDVVVLCPHAKGAQTEEVLDGVRVVRYRYAPRAWETLVNDGGIITNLHKKKWKWLLVPGFFIAQWWVLWRLCRRECPRIVHAHWLIPQGIVAAAVCRAIPFVVTSHGADLFAMHGWLFARMRAHVLARAVAVTVVSHAMRERVERQHPYVSAAVMPMGIDFTALFTPDERVERSPTDILFVGRLVEKKGVIHLIEAMPQVLANYPDARLQIVGFGPERETLAARVLELGIEAHVRFLGAVPQSELPSLFRRAAVCALPFVRARDGDQEGLGLVVVEAIACHCPVIVGDVPAVHDLFDADSEAIVSRVDTAALAIGILRVLGDPLAAQALVTRMRRDLEGRLSWSDVARAYAGLLEAVAGKGSHEN